MTFGSVLDSPCGIRYMFATLDLCSGAARARLLATEMMTERGQIERAYDNLRQFYAVFCCGNTLSAKTLQAKLSRLRDIGGTIALIRNGGEILDDTNLFEVKGLCLLTAEVAELLKQYGLDAVQLPSLDEALTVLDPEGQRAASFHIYDAYSTELADLRRQIAAEKNEETRDALIITSLESETRIRARLTEELQKWAEQLEEALAKLAQTDILLAKALQMRALGLTFPQISTDETTTYGQMFHPQIQNFLEKENKAFQPVDIHIGGEPTVIVGANMGGKTVVLKMLAENQYLFQFGFGIPAAQASIAIRDDVRLLTGDGQRADEGLSAFGAEVVGINAIIAAAKAGKKLLALVDEPARTTNPDEGTALTASLIETLAGSSATLVLTTHYTVRNVVARRLRVRGFENGTMNYALADAAEGGVPHEALTVAAMLGADREWIAGARALLMDN